MLLGHFAASGSGVLNVPSWALAYSVFAVSVIVVLASRSRHVPRPRPRVDTAAAAVARPTPPVVVARVAAAVVTVVLLGFAWFGPVGITGNVASLGIVGVLWPLGGWVALVFGRVFSTIDPFLLLAPVGDRRRARLGLGPVHPPLWAPIPVFATWVVVWIAWIRGDEPRNLAVWLTAYVIGLVVVALRTGTPGLRAANPLPAVLDFTADILHTRRTAPLTTTPTGRSHTALVAALVLGALGANRAADAAWFTSMWPDEEAAGTTLATLAVFGVLTAMIAGLWRLCDRWVERVRGETGSRPIAAALAPSAGGLLLAQGFPVGLIVVQNLIIVASDPLGRGWDVFGTVYHQVSPDPLSGFAMGMIQTGAIVLGQAGALLAIGRGATVRAADGTTSAAARNRAWTAALPAMVFVGLSGVVWTLLLVGR